MDVAVVPIASCLRLNLLQLPPKPAPVGALLQLLTPNQRQLELTELVVKQTILLRKQNKTKLPDVIIAATAIVFDLTLITRNTNDFKNIPNLTVINPYEN